MHRSVTVAALAAVLQGCGPEPAADGAGDPGTPRPDPPDSETYRLERIADDVWATVVKDGVSPSQFAASLIVVRDEDVVVVDSRHDGESAGELIDTIASLTDLPVAFVVNTHWHGDHVQGNERFREAFPGVRFVGGATIDEDMRTLGRERLDEEVERVDGRIAAAEGWLESGTGPDGEKLSPDEVAALPGQIDAARSYADARRDLRLVEPDILVEDAIRLDGEGLRVEVVRVGPAHTRGDVVVRVPERGVVAVGDLIEDGFPYFGDGYPSGWATAMDRIAEMEWTTVLGAHGPVLEDREMFDTQRRFVSAIVEAATTAAMSGESEVPPAAFDEFETHFTARLSEAPPEERAERFAAFVEEVFARALAEANGELESAP